MNICKECEYVNKECGPQVPRNWLCNHEQSRTLDTDPVSGEAQSVHRLLCYTINTVGDCSGYKAKVSKAQQQYDEWRTTQANADHYRRALILIAEHSSHGWAVAIAREALEDKS